MRCDGSLWSEVWSHPMTCVVIRVIRVIRVRVDGSLWSEVWSHPMTCVVPATTALSRRPIL